MSKKILLMDDEDLVILSLKKLLTRAEYDVVIAQDSRLALEIVQESNFDLIISDVRMPYMDGVEVIEQIRDYLEKAEKPLIPEILITGYADLERYERAKRLRVAGYLYKPFDNAELLRITKEILKNTGQHED